MRNEARLELQKDLARHLRAGHPWVFKKALARPAKGLPAGTIVDVVEGDRFVARGYLDPHSAIVVRILTRDEGEAVDAAFWRRRVARAVALRRELVTGTNAYRLLHGESDGLPGVVVDRYDRFAVLKLYSAGLTPHRADIVEAIRAECGDLAGVYGRDEVPRDDDDEGGEGAGRVLWGAEPPEHVAIDEHGMKILVDVRRGQKTGLFLDQRENRHLVRDPGARAGPRRSTSSATPAASRSRRRWAAPPTWSPATSTRTPSPWPAATSPRTASIPADHAFAAGDAFDLLANYKRQGRRFDLVICDPPAFAKSQKAVEGALAGYASLNRAALQVLAPGGLLVTCSCSARVTAEQFTEAVKEAAFKLHVELALVAETRQPYDHPVSLQFREGRYLKALVLRRG